MNFLVGRDTGSEMVPELLPRNVRDVLGPSAFSEEKETLSSENAEVRVLRPYNGVEECGVTIRKSSRRW